MLDFIKETLNKKSNIIDDPQFAFSKSKIGRVRQVKSVKIKDSDTLTISLRAIKNARCLFRNLEEKKRVLVTIWDMPEDDQLTYFVASILWNDRKKDSHMTCSYVTQKHLRYRIEYQFGLACNPTLLSGMAAALLRVPG